MVATSTCTARSQPSLPAVLQRFDEGSAFIFFALAFAAGSSSYVPSAHPGVRLFSDMIGRKYTFLVTILIMGLSTFVVAYPAQLRQHWRGCPRHPDLPALLQGLALGVSTVRHLCGRACPAWQAWRLHLLDPDHRHAGSVPVADGDSGYPYRHR